METGFCPFYRFMLVGVAGGPFTDEIKIYLASGKALGEVLDNRFYLFLIEIHHYTFCEEKEAAVRMFLSQHIHPVRLEHRAFDREIFSGGRE